MFFSILEEYILTGSPLHALKEALRQGRGQFLLLLVEISQQLHEAQAHDSHSIVSVCTLLMFMLKGYFTDLH